MSLLVFKLKGTTTDELKVNFLEKTGIELTESTKGDNYRTLNFPDGYIAKDIKVSDSILYPSKVNDMLYFFDSENCFLWVMNELYAVSYASSSTSIDTVIKIIISKCGDKRLVMSVNGGNKGDYFNMAADGDFTTGTIKLFPTFYAGVGYLDRVFVNYTRVFVPNIRVTDSNGNTFVTLGGYFLYKTN